MDAKYGFLLLCLLALTDAAGNLCCSYPCQHGGFCLTEGFDKYICDCTGTEFYGRHCENPILSRRIKLWLKPRPSTMHNLLTNYEWLWNIVNNIPFLRNFIMKNIILMRAGLIDSPPKYDNEHTYITLDANFNHSFYTRTLPPVPLDCPTPMGVAGRKNLPDLDVLAKKLLLREKFKPDQRGTSLLFPFMAQHFTHMFIKTDMKRGPQFQWGGHGLDVSHIYGKDKHDEDLLRSFVDGKFKLQTINNEEWPLQNKDVKMTLNFFGFVPAMENNSFALGHSFFNNFPGLFMFSTIWMREHNRICDIMKKEHPEWNDERLYQTGKLIVLGETMKIVTEEYIQHLSNYHFQFLYKPELLFDVPFQYQNRIALEFNHLYHWHPLIPDDFSFGGTNYTLNNLLGNPALVIKHGMSSFVDSLSKQIAGKFTVRNHPHFGVKVAKNVIKHGRELRLQSYNNYRKRFNLQPFQSFEQLTGNKKLAKELETLYGDIDGVEFYVGLLSEKLRPKALFSETMMELGSPFSLKGLMSNPLSSPKYWKPSTFGGAVGFDLVKSATLKKLFCQNINGDCPEVTFRVPGFVESQGEAEDTSLRNCPEHGEQ